MIAADRIYQAYYTKSAPIVRYMIDLLDLKGGERIFEHVLATACSLTR